MNKLQVTVSMEKTIQWWHFPRGSWRLSDLTLKPSRALLCGMEQGTGSCGLHLGPDLRTVYAQLLLLCSGPCCPMTRGKACAGRLPEHCLSLPGSCHLQWAGSAAPAHCCTREALDMVRHESLPPLDYKNHSLMLSICWIISLPVFSNELLLYKYFLLIKHLIII